jgi:hypothetical protein
MTTDNDKRSFALLMQYLSTNFPEREASMALIQSYYQDLADFTLEQIEAAARKHVQTGRNFPFVADLRALIQEAA